MRKEETFLACIKSVLFNGGELEKDEWIEECLNFQKIYEGQMNQGSKFKTEAIQPLQIYGVFCKP